MSAALDPVIPMELWSVWTWTTGSSASAEMDTAESSARLTSMTASPHPAGMEVSARIWLETTTAGVPRAGWVRTVRMMRRAAVRPPVRTAPSVWTSSKTSSAHVPEELMVRSVRPHLRDVSETPA